VKTQQDVARYRPLAAKGAVSQQELDTSVQQNFANEAAVEQQAAAVERARLNLDWSRSTPRSTASPGQSRRRSAIWSGRRTCSRRCRPSIRSRSSFRSASAST
jgi:multidrug resistance efflux pump